MSATFKNRVCERVHKRFASDATMIERINERLLNRFGLTCSTSGAEISSTVAMATSRVAHGSDSVVKVSLSEFGPVGDDIPKGASNVHVLRLNLQASCKDAVSIDTITIWDHAPGLSSDITGVWISIDRERVTRPRPLMREKNVTLNFRRTLVIPACGLETLDVFVALSDTARTSSRHQFSIETAKDFFSDANAIGSFPVIGAQFRVSSIQTGTVKVEYLPIEGEIEIAGTDRQIIGKMRVTADTREDQTFQSMYLENNGRSQDGDIAAIYARATQGRARLTEHAGYTVDDRVTVRFDPPFSILKGETIDLDLIADVVDGTGDTIEMSFEENIDFFSVGSLSGYGDNGQLYGSPVEIIGKPVRVRIR
jgi:hypothetical protein